MSKPKAEKNKSFFSPDSVSTRIHQAINRDLSRGTQVYAPLEDWQQLIRQRFTHDFLKKYVGETQDTEQLTNLTFEKFQGVVEHLRGLEMSFPDSDRVQSWTPFRDKALIRAKKLMAFVLGSFRTDEWFVECRNSTGSTVGVPFVDTSDDRKFTYPITVTPPVKTLFDSYLDFDPELESAIENLNRKVPLAHRYQVVAGSRATTVEKDDKIRRMIAVEPTGNMFFQQGLMRILYKRMASVGLKVDCLPDQHRERAWSSSVSCKEATIDWTSASDCVSTELLRWLLPPEWFEVVNLVRCPLMRLRDAWVRLPMFATMGNATTFPLETLVFWTIAHGVRLSTLPGNTLFPSWEDLGVVSVFGDDCIVPTAMARQYIDVLESVGFIVNDQKSFYGNERFRESCGGDYLHGMPVRPVYLRAPSGTSRTALEAWLYTTFNLLQQKYILYFGSLSYVYDKAFFKLVFCLLEESGIRPKVVPDFYPDDAGLKISGDLLRFYLSYKPDFSPVKVGDHGDISFLFLNFKYRERIHKDEGIRYALALRKGGHKLRRRSDAFRQSAFPRPIRRITEFPKRRKGGYVVARGLSSCWTIPRLDALEP